MKRECIAIRSSDTLNRHICVDTKGAKDILKFLKTEQEDFQDIVDQILEQPNPRFRFYIKLKYGYNNVSEMRFNVGRKNERIYCHETTNKHGQLCVVMSKFWGKKTSEGIDKKIKPVIDSIERYVYNIDYKDL
ncbi:MAG: hypothetical protein M3N14_06875 [Bacteroidota bacterium]|nr:hypothetical protein [Bacteroidota bacterium]